MMVSNLDRIKRLERVTTSGRMGVYFANLENGEYEVIFSGKQQKYIGTFTEKQFNEWAEKMADNEPDSVIIVDDVSFWEAD